MSSIEKTAISINYSDEKLRILVEEYIARQRSFFTHEDVCTYVLYWAMEEGHTNGASFYDSDQINPSDSNRIKGVLETIVGGMPHCERNRKPSNLELLNP